MPSATESLGQFIVDQHDKDLPEDVLDRSVIRIIDGLAAGLGGAHNITAEVMRRLGPAEDTGPCTVWLGAYKRPLDEAAFTNTSLAHSIHHDDTGVGGHPGAVVVPSAIAVAEQERATRLDLVKAVAVGYEVQARIGWGKRVSIGAGDRGMRPTALPGAFGAAAVAAYLLRLSPQEAANALAIAASLCAPGIEQPLREGSVESTLQHGENSRAGTTAARWAQAGLSGAELALEGECGFYRTFTGSTMPEEVVSDLGSVWRSVRPFEGVVPNLRDTVVTKAWPTGGWNLGMIYSTERLISEHQVAAADVERVDILMPWWRLNTGYIAPGPFRTIEEATVSGPFAVACLLVYGRYDFPVAQRGVGDAAVAEMAQRIRVDGVATWDRPTAQVTLILKDGRRLSQTGDDMPSELLMPTWPEAASKFKRIVGGSIDEAVADKIVDTVGGIVQMEDATHLGALLGVAAGLSTVKHVGCWPTRPAPTGTDSGLHRSG